MMEQWYAFGDQMDATSWTDCSSNEAMYVFSSVLQLRQCSNGLSMQSFGS